VDDLIAIISSHYGKIIKSKSPPFKIILVYFYLAEASKYIFSMIPFASMMFQHYEFAIRTTLRALKNIKALVPSWKANNLLLKPLMFLHLRKV